MRYSVAPSRFNRALRWRSLADSLSKLVSAVKILRFTYPGNGCDNTNHRQPHGSTSPVLFEPVEPEIVFYRVSPCIINEKIM